MKNWLSGFWLAISAVTMLFVIAFAVSFGFGTDALKGCFLAIVLSLATAFLSVMPHINTKGRRTGFVNTAIWSSSLMRLRVTGMGIFVVCLVLEKKILWFLGWTGFFYVTLLVIETIFVVWFFKVYNWKRYDYFDNDTNEFAVGDDISS